MRSGSVGSGVAPAAETSATAQEPTACVQDATWLSPTSSSMKQQSKVSNR